MATHSVNDVSSLINTQIDSHEKIQELLLKAEALAHVASGGDFLDHEQSILNQYLIALYDIIFQLRYLHESALNHLIKNTRGGLFLG